MEKQFYDVMYKYEKSFSEEGVKANLNMWNENKKNLLSLLSNHPNWNKDALAVVIPLNETRDINSYDVSSHCQSLIQIAKDMRFSQDTLENFEKSISAATEDNSSILSTQSAKKVNEYSSVKCVAGQKSSRVINKLCKFYKVNEHSNFNSVFAQLSNSLSPKEFQRKAILSIHPCDFLEMSNTKNSWDSCHNLEDGSYQAGCLSYMNDSVTMIFYTTCNSITEDYSDASKITRQVFCYDDGLLLQSRLYPNQYDSNAITKYRYVVQDIISSCLNISNAWILKKKHGDDDYDTYFTTALNSKQYKDYIYYGSISTFKEIGSNDKIFDIGGSAFCVCCGSLLSNHIHNIKCSCESKVICHKCGQTVLESNSRYIDRHWECNSCLHICDSCDQPQRDSILYPIFNSDGSTINICAECYNNLPCRECSIEHICVYIGGKFCKRVDLAA